MDKSLLAPDGPSRFKQVQDAKDMAETIKRNAEKSGSTIPPYEFIELIGKGAFGRVYKCRHTETSQLVAVKILNIDDADFEADPRERDETVKDFRKEVEILTQLKDFNAKNVNMIHDAFDLHSQLWIVSDFCTGGSVRTLMRANPRRGLEDKFLIPIARELAIALNSVHDIGVIHRDIKCANVYVTEDGRIQLGDFGVVGVMDNGVAKRTTIIGTPWYMPREMHVDTFSVMQGYGKEVDIWAYGCTIYEMATGVVPNANVAQHMLGTVLEQQAPRLTGEEYSDDLQDFVAFCLNNDPSSRPTADQILRHPYIAGTKTSHPTSSLVALIDRYIVWEHRGGQRTSLFNPGGAAAPVRLESTQDEPVTENDDWNFNTSDSFYGGFAKRYSHILTSEDVGPQFEAPPGAGLPPLRSKLSSKLLSPAERIQQEHAAKSESRGERSLGRIWNQDVAPYDALSHATVPELITNDLPLREYSSNSAPRESTVFIDLDTTPSDDPGSAFNFEFGDFPTVKGKQRASIIDEESEEQSFKDDATQEKRSTMAWTFATAQVPQTRPSEQDVDLKRATMDWSFPGVSRTDEPELQAYDGTDILPFRPQLKHTATAPLGQFGDFIHDGPNCAGLTSPTRESLRSLIDLSLDLSADSTDVPRPSTAVSHTGSTSTILTSGPFDLENETNAYIADEQSRFSIHKQWQSEGGNAARSSLRHVPLHHKGNSLSSTDSEFDHISARDRDYYNDDYLSDVDSESHLDRVMGNMHQPNQSFESNSTWYMIDDEEIEHDIPTAPHLGEFTFPPNNADRDKGYAAGLPRAAQRQDLDIQSLRTFEAINFPLPQPPLPEVLFDRADDALVMNELRRLLKDAGDAFKCTAKAIQQYSEAEPDPSQQHIETDTMRMNEHQGTSGV